MSRSEFSKKDVVTLEGGRVKLVVVRLSLYRRNSTGRRKHVHLQPPTGLLRPFILQEGNQKGNLD